MMKLTDKPKKPLIAASILSADFGHMIDQCRDVLDKGADLLHIDVMDGHFVSNLTMGADMIRALRQHLPDVFLDVHLMVERPGDYVEAFSDAGADCFTFHLEVCRPFHPNGIDAAELIERIRGRGMNPGMAINPYTPAEPLEPFLNALDLVLVMSVVPGRSGQSFMPKVLEKARWLSDRLGEHTRHEIDGGINEKTARQAVAAGVEVLVAASAIFGAQDRAGAIKAIRGVGPAVPDT